MWSLLHWWASFPLGGPWHSWCKGCQYTLSSSPLLGPLDSYSGLKACLECQAAQPCIPIRVWGSVPMDRPPSIGFHQSSERHTLRPTQWSGASWKLTPAWGKHEQTKQTVLDILNLQLPSSPHVILSRIYPRVSSSPRSGSNSQSSPSTLQWFYWLKLHTHLVGMRHVSYTRFQRCNLMPMWFLRVNHTPFSRFSAVTQSSCISFFKQWMYIFLPK